MRLFANANYDFIRLRRIGMLISAALIVPGLLMLLIRGVNYSVEFTGGTLMQIESKAPIDVGAVRNALASRGIEGAEIQTFGSGNDLLVRLQPKPGVPQTDTSQTADEVLKAVSTPGNAAQLRSSGYVGPQIGKELAENSFYALAFVVVGFAIYITFRFEWKFALAAIITTLHDVVVVAGWFALTGHEFDLTVLAGVLSVMGYSINDTIVVFDRVRENFRSLRLEPAEVLNRSVNQTLSRTVITSFVAFLTVLALYIYGGGSLRGMAESQMIGIVVGTLSSIFVACPLLMWLNVTKQDLMPKSRDDSALARRP